jgi:isopenicillin-N epimerase
MLASVATTTYLVRLLAGETSALLDMPAVAHMLTTAYSPLPTSMPHSAWDLRPDVIYLNHGSFGPSPRVVVEERCRWYRELEAEPMDFFTRRLEAALADARGVLGKFLGTSGDNLIFVDNATWAMNIVAESCELQPGDEVLLNDHEYGAVHRIWERRCHERGAKLVVAKIPTPLKSADDVIEPLFAAVTPRTRMIVFSHVTSPTAIIFPATEICRRARQLGIATCVDGPHALVMCDVNLDQLDCDYYCASNHKWLCAPFGSGFLFVHPRRQSTVQPVVTSWGRSYPPDLAPAWHNEFTWGGTRDCSAYLATPTAIQFIESVGVEHFRHHAHALVRQAREQIGQLTGREPLVPDDMSWYGSMISLPIPPGDALELHKAIWDRYRIEVPIVDWGGQRLVRPSAHLYTRSADIDRLVEALKTLL